MRLRRCSGHRHDRRRQLSAGRQLRHGGPRHADGVGDHRRNVLRRSEVSCAYKLSTAASLAVQAAYLAREGCFVPAGVGIIGNTIEQTFANVGRLNDPGMVATDRELVAIIAENQRHMAGRS